MALGLEELNECSTHPVTCPQQDNPVTCQHWGGQSRAKDIKNSLSAARTMSPVNSRITCEVQGCE